MTKKKAIYAQNARKWTPARHKQFQETLARKRAERAVKDKELGAVLDQFRKDPFPLPDAINTVNAGMAGAVEPAVHYGILTQQIDALRQKNESLKAKLDVYEDLLFRAIKD